MEVKVRPISRSKSFIVYHMYPFCCIFLHIHHIITHRSCSNFSDLNRSSIIFISSGYLACMLMACGDRQKSCGMTAAIYAGHNSGHSEPLAGGNSTPFSGVLSLMTTQGK